MIAVVRQRSRTKAWVFVVLLLLVAVVGSVSYLAWRQSVPVRARHRAGPDVPRPQRLRSRSRSRPRAVNCRSAEVRIVQGGSPMTIARPAAPLGPQVTLPILIAARRARPEGRRGDARGVGRDDFWRPLRPGDRALTSRAGHDRPHATAAGAAGRHALHLARRRRAGRLPRARRLPRGRECRARESSRASPTARPTAARASR